MQDTPQQQSYTRWIMKKLTSVAVIILTATLSLPTMAANFSERESLAKLMHELDALHLLIDEAEGRSDPNARVKMQYSLLRSDLAKFRFGVKEYLDSPTIEPRKYAPLSGDYVQ